MSKAYIIKREKDGAISLLCQGHDKKGNVVEERPAGPFDIGNSSTGTYALALAIMLHYMGANANDAAATAEAKKRAPRFMTAFLSHHPMREIGATYDIDGSRLDYFFSVAPQ